MVVEATQSTKPKVAVWKFASCDGCQLSLLDCEDELLLVTEAVELAYFLEATRAVVKGPYDLSLVEGSITTEHDRQRLLEVRRVSKMLVTIGACATSGGIQALRNFGDVAELSRAVYPHPEYIETLATSTPISAHVPVDYELHGCPIDKRQLLLVLRAVVRDQRPRVREHSVCIECKRRGITCRVVAEGAPCLGPVTQAGCGALCPSYARGCFGCFGPADGTNVASWVQRLRENGTSELELQRLFSTFNVAAPAFIPAHRLLERRGAVSRTVQGAPNAEPGES